jgi:hypothetical protein
VISVYDTPLAARDAPWIAQRASRSSFLLESTMLVRSAHISAAGTILLAVLFSVFITGVAFGQPVISPAMVPVTMVSLSPLWAYATPILTAVILAVVTALGGTAMTYAWKRWPKQLEALGLQNDAAGNAMFGAGASRLAASFLKELIALGIEPASIRSSDPRVIAVATDLMGRFPQIVKLLNITPATAVHFIMTELDKHLVAANAIVPPKPPVATPATAAPLAIAGPTGATLPQVIKLADGSLAHLVPAPVAVLAPIEPLTPAPDPDAATHVAGQ